MPRRLRTLAAAVLGAALSSPAAALDLDFVTVGAPDNPPTTRRTHCCNYRVLGGRDTGFGAVADAFRITRGEITVAAWVEFLNAVAAADPHGLWNERMALEPPRGCIARDGEAGAHTYRAIPGQEETPIRFVSWFDALRFVNWLHHGQPRGAAGAAALEDGAYRLGGASPAEVARAPGARFWLPDEDEWYKAAYYDPASGGYRLYGPAGDAPPIGRRPGQATLPNEANLCPPSAAAITAPCSILEGPGAPTPVCAYPGRSPFGLCDTVGNAIEMTETREVFAATGEPVSVARGGHFRRGLHDNSAAGRNFVKLQAGDSCFFCGFRVAASLPSAGRFENAEDAVGAPAAQGRLENAADGVLQLAEPARLPDPTRR